MRNQQHRLWCRWIAKFVHLSKTAIVERKGIVLMCVRVGQGVAEELHAQYRESVHEQQKYGVNVEYPRKGGHEDAHHAREVHLQV